jgi:protein-tyrosine phosphatase
MKKILLVCMGNICRSPMAEGVVRDVFKQRGIEAELDSAGTISFHSGESPDRRAIAELHKHKIDISKLKARQIKSKDLEYYDHIFAMDQNNYADILTLTPTGFEHKVDMFMNISEPDKNIAIPDPYYGGEQGFTNVYEMIKKSAEALADKIINNKI